MPDERVFFTGATGFLGTSLLETMVSAGARVTILTRDPAAFRIREPRLAPAVELVAGDVRSFSDPAGEFPYVIHGAAETTLTQAEEIICQGTARVIDFARRARAHRLLFLSSGAVYGPQPASLESIPEDYRGEPSTPYGHAKREAERQCIESGIPSVIARCFAFIGPRMPLDGTFAAGNFVRDALAGRDIEIKGDGTDVRTYLYADDCAEWLRAMLLRGRAGEAYNVGSDVPVTIAELARTIADAAPRRVGVRILGQGAPGVSRRYVPSIEKARRELGLTVRTPLSEAVRSTLLTLYQQG